MIIDGVVFADGLSYPYKVDPFPLMVILLFTYKQMSLYSPVWKFKVSPSFKLFIFVWIWSLESVVSIVICEVDNISLLS